MWYDGQNSFLGRGIGLAESGDGIAWTKHPNNPLIGVGNPGEWDSGYRGQLAIMQDGSLYKMWYSGGPDGDGPWQTGYATSTDGLDWTIYPGNPVLQAGGVGDWDEMESDGPTVILDGGVYKMWFHGCNGDYSICSIGYATSTNGIDWTKYGSNPVLTPGISGTWDAGAIVWPYAVKNGGAYYLWYDSNGQIGLATSSDGISWTKSISNPVLTTGWDGSGVGGQTILLEGSTYKMWFRSGTGENIGIGYAESTDGINWTTPYSNPVLRPGSPNMLIDVNYAHDWVYATTAPGASIVITVANGAGGIKATVSGQSNFQGYFGSWEAGWDPEQPDIQPGDIVSASAAGETTVINPVGTIDGVFDADTELVSGTVNAPWFTTVTVRCEVWVDSGPPPVVVTGVDADGGGFQCDFDGIWNIQPWETVAVRYIEPDSDTVINIALPLQLLMNVNYGHDWIEGNYEAGHTIWITVTESDGITPKGMAELQTGEVPWWGGQTGFSTNWQGWSGPQPDILPGDWVYGVVDNGYANVVQVGNIDGVLDVDNDLVTTTLNVSWFTQTLNVNCNVENGPGEGFTLDPNGGIHVTDFFTLGWDLQPGQNVWLWYQEPDGDQVGNVLRFPAPEVGVWKWTPSGHARPGGVYVYGVSYANNGDGVAADTIIVDTLPMSTTWAGDTSGVAPTIGPTGVITWYLGDLPPGADEAFMVTLQVGNDVPTGSGVIGSNCAYIATTAVGDDNPGNDSQCTGSVDVWESDVDVAVGKNPNPGDPAPGQEFEYRIHLCSERGAAYGPVWLTDTLPLFTTFVSWRPDNWEEAFWTEVVTTGGQLVLYAPGLPGDWCQSLYLRLLLDPAAPLGAVLQNTVVITTPGDVDPNDNVRVNSAAYVSGPRYDLRLDKSVHRSVPIPDGWINYFIWYGNEGNMAAHVWITDTIPAGLSYQYAHWGGGQPGQNEPLPDPTIIGDQIIWDLGELPVNGSRWFHIQMNVSDALLPGDTITNCATLGIDGGESTPGNNISCYPVTLNEPGPNLRVSKQHEWRGGNNDQLYYQIRFENVGDQAIYNAWVTDTLPEFTTWDGWWNMDFDWNQLISQNLGSSVLAWQFSELNPGDSGRLQFNANLDDPNARPRWYTNTVEITTPPGDTVPDDNTYVDVAVNAEVERVELTIDPTGSNGGMWGQAAPGWVTLTTPYAQVTAWADPGCNGCWGVGNEIGPIDAGDTIVVEAGAGIMPVTIIIPDPFTAEADSSADQVWGQIEGWTNQQLQIHGGWPGGYQEVTTDASGYYTATYSDVPRGARGYVRYETEIDYAEVIFHRRFQAPDLLITVDYEHDWVNGNYEPGHTAWLTLTEGDGVTVKATAVLTTGPIPEWGGQSGFNTHGEDWTPNNPNIAPGDWVYGLLNSVSYTTTVHVGTINGVVDVDAETVSGTLDAPWLAPDLVTVRCEIHENNGPPGIEVYGVDPDGGSFFCNFAGQWDIQPGHNVAVNYTEPDGDWVQTHPANPAPHLRLQMGADGNPAEGNNFTFHVQYQNGGDLAAENVVITDTMWGMAYLTDTSGVASTGANPVVWELGTVQPGDWIQFDVFVNITAVESDTITNTVQIATSNPYDQGDPGEKESWWTGHVVANDTQFNIGKQAWTGDPAPGYDVIFTVNPCNNGSTASSQVFITDTLHPSLTLQYWWAESAGWIELSSSDHQLALSRPSISSWRCEQVYVRAHVDENAWPGLSIFNMAVVYAASDLSSGDDETWWWGSVNTPHTNLNLNKRWHWGQLVPGGEIRYWIDLNNTGNVPVADDIYVTDTLPLSTTYAHAWLHWRSQPSVPLVPVSSGPGYVVWNVGPLDNGYASNIEVALMVDAEALPGTILTNTAAVSPQPDEDSYDDNTSTWVETLYDHGPNLRVSKSGNWHDWGWDTRQIEYNVDVENVGDAPVDWVTITDTYPASMYMNSGVNMNYWRWWNWLDDPANHRLTVTLEALYPGERVGFNFTVFTDTNPIPDGLIFTNTAEVTLVPNDTNPGDNADEYVLTTGPNLWVKKNLAAGDPLPGEIITFSLTYGNDREGWQWWWNTQGSVWVTDTLPAGLEFITATRRSWGWAPYLPDVNDSVHLAWNTGNMPAGGEDAIYLTVRITDTATGLDIFTNWAEVASDQPISDTEPYYDDNSNYYDVAIALPYFEIGKDYASSLVAGMSLTYTITVTNVGNEMGTGIIVTDALPLEVGGSVASWDIASLAAYGGVTQVMTNVTLPCTAGAAFTNQWYRVATSDQGVTSDWGPALALATIAPTINTSLSHSPATTVAGGTIYFTATAGTNGTPLDYAWDWGAGPVSGGLTASHVYTQDGTYTVVFTATDACGYSDAAQTTVTVNPPTLVADFDQSATSVLVNSAVYFTDTSTTNGPAIVDWGWTFGDGGTSGAQNPSHTYTATGTYTVTLLVTDSLGYTDIYALANAVTVQPGCTPVTGLGFTYAPVPIIVQQAATFTATYTAGDPAPTFAWSFDGGAPESGQAVAHTFTTAGAHTVAVTATNACGSVAYSRSVSVESESHRIYLPMVLRNSS